MNQQSHNRRIPSGSVSNENTQFSPVPEFQERAIFVSGDLLCDKSPQDEMHLHHYPNAPGLEQAMQTSPDAWVEFFTLCREYAEVLRQRRAEKQKTGTETLTGEAVQENS